MQEVAYPSIAVDEWRPLLPQIASKLKEAIARAKESGFPDKKGQFVLEALKSDSSPKKKRAYLDLIDSRRGKRPDLTCMSNTVKELNSKFNATGPLTYNDFLNLYLRAAAAFTGCASEPEQLNYRFMNGPYFVLPILWRTFTEEEFLRIANVPLHFASLIDEVAFADQRGFDPNGFLVHDLFAHMEVRRNGLELPAPGEDLQTFEDRTIIRSARFEEFYSETQAMTHRQGIQRALFYWLHEEGLAFGNQLLETITTRLVTSDSEHGYGSTRRDANTDFYCGQSRVVDYAIFLAEYDNFLEDCKASNELTALALRYLADSEAAPK